MDFKIKINFLKFFSDLMQFCYRIAFETFPVKVSQDNYTIFYQFSEVVFICTRLVFDSKRMQRFKFKFRNCFGEIKSNS